jgi:hypothetical protein
VTEHTFLLGIIHGRTMHAWDSSRQE